MTVKASYKVEQFYFVAKKLFWLQNIFLLLEPLKNCYKQKDYFSNKFDWLKYIDRFVGHFLTENTRSTRSHARGPKSTCSSSAGRHWLVRPRLWLTLLKPAMAHSAAGWVTATVWTVAYSATSCVVAHSHAGWAAAAAVWAVAHSLLGVGSYYGLDCDPRTIGLWLVLWAVLLPLRG